jgi:hypothetical protein
VQEGGRKGKEEKKKEGKERNIKETFCEGFSTRNYSRISESGKKEEHSTRNKNVSRNYVHHRGHFVIKIRTSKYYGFQIKYFTNYLVKRAYPQYVIKKINILMHMN